MLRETNSKVLERIICDLGALADSMPETQTGSAVEY